MPRQKSITAEHTYDTRGDGKPREQLRTTEGRFPRRGTLASPFPQVTALSRGNSLKHVSQVRILRGHREIPGQRSFRPSGGRTSRACSTHPTATFEAPGHVHHRLLVVGGPSAKGAANTSSADHKPESARAHPGHMSLGNGVDR